MRYTNPRLLYFITRAISEYMTESEARAVARWDVGSCNNNNLSEKSSDFHAILYTAAEFNWVNVT